MQPIATLRDVGSASQQVGFGRVDHFCPAKMSGWVWQIIDIASLQNMVITTLTLSNLEAIKFKEQ